MPTNHHKQFDIAVHMLKIKKRDRDISKFRKLENYKYLFTTDRKKNNYI